jgi:hypothetical protein
MAGKEIYQKCKKLNSLRLPQSFTQNENLPTSSEIMEIRMNSKAAQNELEVNDLPICSKTTEVQITLETAQRTQEAAHGFDEKQNDDSPSISQTYPQYAVNIESHYLPPTKTGHRHARRTAPSSSDLAAWAYVKCALLFFIALLITWVSSAALCFKCQSNLFVFRFLLQSIESIPSCIQELTVLL